MACTLCQSPEHDTANHPKPEPDKVDRLIEVMTRAMETRSTSPAPSSDPPPLQRATGPTEEEIANTFQELVNKGQGGQAYQYISNQVLTPRLQGMMIPVLTSLGDSNIERLRAKHGKKFASREPLFESELRRLNMSHADLASMKTAEDIWTLVRGSDPTYEQEVTDERLVTARAQWEAENSAKNALPLGPTPTPWRGKVESKDEAEKLLPKDPEVREYLERQLEAYGVPHDSYLEEIRKESDPEATQRVGVGPFAKRTWTIIGKANDPTIRRLKRGRE